VSRISYVSPSLQSSTPSSSFLPIRQFSHPNFWWPNIDNALRRAAWRGVKVRLLFGLWEHSAPEEIPYWQSLSVLENVEVRVFRVPALKGSPPIPFTRVYLSLSLL